MPSTTTNRNREVGRAVLPGWEAALNSAAGAGGIVVARGADERLCSDLARRSSPAVVVLTGCAVPGAELLERLLATGGVCGIASPWLPDEAVRLLGDDVWRVLQPVYHWLPPLTESRPRAVGSGLCWLRDELPRGESEIVRQALAAVAGHAPEVVVWPAEPISCGGVCVVESADADALAWAMEGEGSRWAAVVDLQGRLSVLRTLLSGYASRPQGSDGAGESVRSRWRPVARALARRGTTTGCAVSARAWSAALDPLAADTLAGRLSWQTRMGLRSLDAAAPAESLLDAWCDGYVHDWRRSWAALIWDSFAAGVVALAPERACALAFALGKDTAAENGWRQCGDPGARRAALWRIVRQRLPWNRVDAPKPAVSVWERPLRWAADLRASSGDPGDVVLAAHVMLAAGGGEEAVALCREAGLSAGAPGWSVLAVQLWAGGWIEAAAKAMDCAGDAEADDPGGRFVQAVARALCRPNERTRARLAEIGGNPAFLAPAAPAHTRCQFLALALAALGCSEASDWWRRALVEDPSAAMRTEAWRRACRQGGLPS